MQATWVSPDSDALTIARAQWLVSKLPMIYLGNAVSAAGLAIGLWFIQSPASLLLWAAFALGHIFTCRGLTWRPSHRSIKTLQSAHNWARYVGFSCLLQGVIWGAAAPLFLVLDSPVHVAVVTLILAGVVVGGVPLMSSHPMAFALFAVPATLPAVYVFAVGPPEFLFMAGITAALAGIAIIMALDNHRTVVGAVRLRLEKEQLVDQLEHQVQRAENALSEKSRYFAAASHDLRQPLTALNLFAGELQQSDTAGALAAAPIQSIRDSLQTLNDLFDSLLDLSKLDAGAVQVAAAPTALGPLFTQLRAEFSGQAQAKGLQLRVVPTQVAVFTDATHLRRILANLISNAVRHTQRGTVLLGCRREADRIRIEVWDTGPGIPVDQRKAIFDEFYQLPANAQGQVHGQGKGLGLAIVKRLANLLHAPLDLRSQTDKGSVFSISLPRCETPAHTAVSAPATEPSFARATALVVDNDAAVLKALCQQLEHWDCQILPASNRAAAFQQIETTAPDIILSDYRLDNGDTGLELIHAVRKKLNRSVPAAIISGDSLASQHQVADRGEVFPVLAKPLRPAKLRLLVGQLLKPPPVPNGLSQNGEDKNLMAS